MIDQGNATLETQFTYCSELPPNLHSPGLLNYTTSHKVPYMLPNLEMQIVLIFVATQAFHVVLRHFGVPQFTSQILAGIYFSPTLLGNFETFKEFVFSLNSQETLGLLAEFGYGLFMFLIGTKMDLGMIRRTGHKAWSSGATCIVVPLVIGWLVQAKLTSSVFKLNENDKFKLTFATVTHSITSFPVVALFLEELKILNSEIGRLAISASFVSDMFSVVLQLLGTMARMGKDKSIRDIVFGVGASISYIIFVFVALRPAMLWVVRQTPENRPVRKAYVNIIIFLMLISGILSHNYGQTFHFGPFIFGLAVPAGPPLGSAIEAKLTMFVFDVFLPLYVTTSSMRIDLWSLSKLSTDQNAQVNGIIILVTLVAKLLGSLATPLYCNMPFNDALALALILTSKGIIQLASYTSFRDNQTIDEQTFALSIICVFLTATFVPIAVRCLYDPSRKYAGYQKRNMMHLKPNAELKMLTCIHRSANMPAVINLLDAACPSKEHPIAVNVLHLIESVGRASPVFISHQMQKKSGSSTSYSDNVILYFNNFVRENIGAVSLSIFTAISSPKFMHEDICTLALDKLVSLIVLPFHRRWGIDGSVDSEDHTIRTLNCSVIDTAPCSVGILVDRSHLGRSTSVAAPEASFSVAVVFLGGKDDREALTFARRMAKDSTISLTVIRLVSMTNNEADRDWEDVLDTEELKNFRYDVGEGFVVFLEEVVKDGPQTAIALRSLVDEYHLVIVGRRDKVRSRQTSGLSEWSEFPELGVIGDLLASPDINCKASILVVQQQKMIT